MVTDEHRVRLDKWLWAARFFKTRALAGEAVTGGKVHLQGHRVKPSRGVKIDDCFEIQRGYERFEIIVTAISARRRGGKAQAGDAGAAAFQYSARQKTAQENPSIHRQILSRLLVDVTLKQG